MSLRVRRLGLDACGVWGWVCADPTGRSPRRLVWDQEQGLGSEHPAGGRQLGRRPGVGSFLAAAALGAPGLGSVSAKAQGEAGMRASFSLLTAALPSEELEPAPSSWAAAGGGVVPAATSAGDQEPAGDLATAYGEPGAIQEEPLGEPAHGEPAPACAPVLAPDPAPALDPAPATAADPVPALASVPAPVPGPSPTPAPTPALAGLPELHPEPTALRGQLLVQSPLVPSPKPDAPPECCIPSPYILSLWYILAVILSFHVLYAVYYLF